MVAYFDFFGPRGEVVWYGGGVNLNRPQMAKCREELYVSKRQSRIWFIVSFPMDIDDSGFTLGYCRERHYRTAGFSSVPVGECSPVTAF
jgi:hypothetical protein